MTVEEIGRLEAYGFEEPEPGLVPDTEDNRQRLIKMKWSWTRDRDEDGHLTGLLIPVDPETLTEEHRERAFRRRHLLANPTDHWSDYKHPDDIDLDLELPTWVRSRLRKWREDASEGVPESERRPFPTRCVRFRYDGTRCVNWVNRPEDTPRCSRHVNNNKEELRSSAAYSRQQLIDFLPFAVDNLTYLATHADGEAVRLKATTEVMDRAGLSSKTELDVTATVHHSDPGEDLRERLTALAKRAETIVTEEPDGTAGPLLALPPGDNEVVEAELVEEEASP